MNAGVSSLEFRLAAKVGAGLLLLFLTSLAVIVTYSYRYTTEKIAEEHVRLVETLREQAEVAAFAGNNELAQDVVSGLLSFESIQHIRLTADNGFVIWAPDERPAQSVHAVETFALRSPIDPDSVIGEIDVVTNTAYVKQKVIMSALRAVGATSIQTLAVLVLVAVAYRSVVGSRISSLANRIASLEPGTSFRLRMSPQDAQNEIGKLIECTNGLLDSAEIALEKERALAARVNTVEQQYRNIFDTTSVGILMLNNRGHLINCNSTFDRDLQQRCNELRVSAYETDVLDIMFEDTAAAWDAVNRSIRIGSPVGADFRLDTIEDEDRWMHCIFNASIQADGSMDMVEAVVYEVTRRRNREQAARRIAETDSLTGLLNRRGVQDRIHAATSTFRFEDEKLAVAILDLDGFKAVNDNYGHDAGDEVLRVISQRLQELFSDRGDVVGRLGGDEFLVAATLNTTVADDLEQRFANLVAAVREPISLGEDQPEVQVGTSIGVAVYPDDSDSLASLMQFADAAMYEVKRQGKNDYRFYESGSRDKRHSQGGGEHS